MLKLYRINGMTYQFHEGKQPAGAVEVKADKPANKAAKKSNKSAKKADK